MNLFTASIFIRIMQTVQKSIYYADSQQELKYWLRHWIIKYDLQTRHTTVCNRHKRFWPINQLVLIEWENWKIRYWY